VSSPSLGRPRPGLRRRRQVRAVHASPCVARTPRSPLGLFKVTAAPWASYPNIPRRPCALARKPPETLTRAAAASRRRRRSSSRSCPGDVLGGEEDTGVTCFRAGALSRPRAVAGVSPPPPPPFGPCIVFIVGEPSLLPRLSLSRHALHLGENREANRAL
jgi:hypothetical protein